MPDNVEPSESALTGSLIVQRAVQQHGRNVKEHYDVWVFDCFVRSLIPGFCLCIIAGAIATAIMASGWLMWVAIGWAVLTARFSWRCLRAIGCLARDFGNVVLIYDDKLIFQKGTRFQAISWEQIEAVYLHTFDKGDGCYALGRPNNLWYVTAVPIVYFWDAYTEIQLTDGTRFRVPSTFGVYEDLSATIQGEVVERQIEQARARLLAGETLRFGPIILRPDKLQIGDGEVVWAEHYRTWRHEGYLVTEDNVYHLSVGEWVPLREVPNAIMVANLITEVSHRHPVPADDADADDEEM